MRLAPLVLVSLSLSLASFGCGSDADNEPDPVAPGGHGGHGGQAGQGGQGTGGSGPSGGFTPPADPGPGGVLVTVSGEDLASVGYDFMSGASLANGDPPAFVDGWEVRFEHILVTLDHIALSADPDKDAGNPRNVGPVVAQVDGPFAVDVVRGGSLPGKSGSPDEKTVAIAAFAGPDGGGAFSTTDRYAFSYEVTAAAAGAKIVNLDDAGKALYDQGVAQGWAFLFQGTATYKGPAPAPGSVFEKIPNVVHFTLGMRNPARYLNCQNTDLQAVGEDQFPRGVQAIGSRSVTAQITIHTDHGFWDRLNTEGTPLHFDAIAAQASTYGTVNAPPGEVTLDDLDRADFTGFKTRDGEILPGRSAVSDYSAPAGQLYFDPSGTNLPKNSYARYFSYSVIAGGHLNADGLCVVVPGFTP
jgi:hypothetical protein